MNYTRESAIEKSKLYKTVSELLKNGRGLYAYLSRNNMLIEIYPSINEKRILSKDGKKRCKSCDEIFDLSNFKNRKRKLRFREVLEIF